MKETAFDQSWERFMSERFHLVVSRSIVDGMLQHAQAEAPRECCGLLAGPKAPVRTTVTGMPMMQAVHRYALVNEARNPAREYLSDPRSMLAAVRDMRVRGFEIVAVYHSHPETEAVPSRTDRARSQDYTNVAHFIVCLKPMLSLRAWWICPEDHYEATWEIVEA